MKRISFILICSLAGGVSLAQSLPGNDLFSKKKLQEAKINIDQKIEQVKQQVQEQGIPLIGDLSDSDEVALGRETAGRILSASPLIQNDSLQRYVNLIGTYVAQQSKRTSLPWTFGVIASEDINAFAMPGGYIVVTKGLYKLLQNEAELAGILAHEIAHVNLRHHVHLMQKELLIVKGRDMLLGQTRSQVIKELAGSGAEICARSLDKKSEYESDRTGVEYSARAGYDPFAYLDILDRIGANNRTDRLSLLYSTHPHPKDRLIELGKALGSRYTGVTGVVPTRWVKF